MAKLTEAVKRHIVLELAMFRTPTEVSESVREVFGIEVDRRQVHEYDPEGSKSGDLAKKWKELHATTREEFKKATAAAAVSQRAFRLRELESLYRTAKSRGAITLAANFLEQAAKECGDVFTNRHKVEQTSVPHEDWLKQLS